jgi:two-component system, chemotaxis family, sensor kinase CheA
MELTRYLDLYLAETQEHLRALGRGLLALESGGSGKALEDAFRAAHTIKGMSGAMGFLRVTELAHRLEDLLADVRGGTRPITPALVDQLLAGLDELERAVEGAAAGQGASPLGAQLAAVPEPATGARLGVVPSPAGARALRIRLALACTLKAARALIVVREVMRAADVLGQEPAEFARDFDGEFRVFLAEPVDLAAVEQALRRAGEVESVVWEGEGEGDAVRIEAPSPAAPLRSRHMRVEQLHMDELAHGIGELGILQGRLEQLVPRTDAALGDVAGRIRRLVGELQETVLAVRMVPVAEVFERLPRVVRDAARSLGKEVEFVVEGRDIKIDRAILEELVDPLVHLLRNAVDHGIETPAERKAAGKPESARLTLRATRERASIAIRVEDDGRGVDRRKVAGRAAQAGLAVGVPEELGGDDLLRLLAHSGLSTAEEVTSISGRGVGLDVVLTRTRSLGGAVELQTEEGRGASFLLRLPITLAVAQALRVRVGEEDYAIPLTHVTEAVELDAVELSSARGQEVIRLRDEIVPLVRLRRMLNVPGAGTETGAVLAAAGERRAAIAVDELVGREQIVVRDFDAARGTLPLFSGVTLLADGRPALVLDPVSVL